MKTTMSYLGVFGSYDYIILAEIKGSDWRKISKYLTARRLLNVIRFDYITEYNTIFITCQVTLKCKKYLTSCLATNGHHDNSGYLQIVTMTTAYQVV